MSGSFHIGRVFGIHVRMHWTFLVLVFVLLPLLGAPFLLVLFGSVFLHELGHSVVAMRYGIRVLDITFWPLGGMARMTEIPEDPRMEGAIALAGPAVNFVLAALFALIWIPLSGGQAAGGLLTFAPPGAAGWAELARGAMQINLLLGLFNLVPAFPMDGGRVLRAYLALKRPWLRATEMAVGVGRQLALGTILASVIACPITAFTRGSFPITLPLIAGFVWIAGGRELWAVRMRELQKRQATHQSIFDLFRSPRFGGTPGPAAWMDPDAAEEVEVEVELEEPAADRPPRDVDARGARRSRGFTDDDVRRLEDYRGSLGSHRRDGDRS